MLLRKKELYLQEDYNDTNDLYYIAYNSFYQDHKALFHVMDLQQNYINRESFHARPICILFYYTDVTSEVISRLIDQLEYCNDHMEKVAIVGLPLNARAWFRLKVLRQNSALAPFQFFSNARDAMNWLHQ